MHLYLTEAKFTVCQKCKKEILPHLVCKYCGFYKNIERVDTLAKINKKDRKQKEKETGVPAKKSAPQKPKQKEAGEKK